MTAEVYYEQMNALLRGHGVANFSARELCPVGRTTPSGVKLQAPPCALWPNMIPTVKVAEWLRQRFGVVVIVDSGYRDKLYNRAIIPPSTDGSMHVQFSALDIRLPGIPPARVAAELEKHPDAARMGIGVYQGFTHIDTRGTRARW
jgi:uncharacterized protein YcbK (DUF882 family)